MKYLIAKLHAIAYALGGGSYVAMAAGADKSVVCFFLAAVYFALAADCARH